jgi:aminopeptidase-like protein
VIGTGNRQAPTAAADLGQEMYALIAELYPICRSITGDGIRQTLRTLARHIPLQLHEVASGTPVFDWTVPKEWNIRDAYVKNAAGERVIDFQAHTLHVMSYSVPVHGRMRLAELKGHLFTLPEQPDLIPYRTSYYREAWGFCLRHRDLLRLEDDEYEVCIDSSLEPGHLTYGEYLVPGEIADEVLISTHACHPSMCNDNLSGLALVTFLAREISGQKPRHTYRFLFIPGTIGSITWLALHQDVTPRIKHGLVITGVGDPGMPVYKRSRRGNTAIDRAMEHVLQHSGHPYRIIDFYPYGYDERQYCSPGFNLAVGRFTRTPHGEYPEYHTSGDNLDFVRPEVLAESLALCRAALTILEHDRYYVNQNPYCEPQLGKRGLYSLVGGSRGAGIDEMAMLWVLNLADGDHSLLDMAERAHMPFASMLAAADALRQHDLLR